MSGDAVRAALPWLAGFVATWLFLLGVAVTMWVLLVRRRERRGTQREAPLHWSAPGRRR